MKCQIFEFLLSQDHSGEIAPEHADSGDSLYLSAGKDRVKGTFVKQIPVFIREKQFFCKPDGSFFRKCPFEMISAVFKRLTADPDQIKKISIIFSDDLFPDFIIGGEGEVRKDLCRR